MSRIKKFTDFFAIFGAFSAAMYLIMKFMPFKTMEEDAPILTKIKEFFSPELKKDYIVFLILFLLFFGSFLFSRIFPKLPSLHFGISLLPLAWSFFMFDYIQTIFEGSELTNRLKEHPMLFLICALLNTVGALADCFLYDRKNGSNHSVIASWIPSALLLHISLNMFIKTRFMPEDLSEITYQIHFAHVDANAIPRYFEMYLWIAIVYGVILTISILLRKLHYISAVLSLLAAGFAIGCWHGNDLPLFGAAIWILAVSALVCHLGLTFIPRQRQEQPEH
ncbi:MAG: hypothetical protein IKD18_06390 [Clostridia bacterium]|nr:hypothetical protein [Clostridia bacterium]MBR7165891.1 hypothetical protein [Clostridia bacterium]